MNALSIVPAILMATTLCGCAQFSTSHFLKEGFGFDLSPYLQQHESSYKDGILEVYDVSPDDELYKKIFSDDSGMHTEPTLFIQKDTEYSAAQFIMIERSDEFTKFVLYLPEEKTMVFIYADGVGG